MKAMPKVNPDILVWARETAGLSPEDAVEKLGIKDARGVEAVARLAALEDGSVEPTRPMIVKMSKQYRRSLLTFYMVDKPNRGDRGEDFRTLPSSGLNAEKALADVVVRDIRVRQELVKSGLQEVDEAKVLSFVGSKDVSDGVEAVARAIADQLNFDRMAFRNSNREDLGGFNYLRALTERLGVFVLLVDNLGNYKTTIGVETFRGFALADDIAPFVAVNANDSRRAWSFTLIHELAHLWIGKTGVSGRAVEQRIEKFCNDVASEVLFPTSELRKIEIKGDEAFDEILKIVSETADRFNVSATMVAYKLFRHGRVDNNTYHQLANTFRQAFLSNKAAERERNKEKEGGPTYHMIRQHRAGKALLGLVDHLMGVGALSATRAGKVLGVGAKNVHPLLEQARPGYAS